MTTRSSIVRLPIGWILAVAVAFKLGRITKDFEMTDILDNKQRQGRNSLQGNMEETTVKPDLHEYSKIKHDNDDNGWHSIDVFYGNTSQLDSIPPPPAFRGPTPSAIQDWYGQAQQDKIVMDLFVQTKKGGYFVDLAANDARTYSNTFALERRFGWKGLCIEPNPMYWHDLSYRNCQVVAAVVGRHRMEPVSFRFQTGVLGGIVNDLFDVTPQKDAAQYSVDTPPTPKYTVPLVEILKRYKAPKTIDYLSLDVEGAEEYIMGIFPFDQYSINVMTIERPNQNLQLFLRNRGFTLLQNVTRWGETLWAHESFLQERQQ